MSSVAYNCLRLLRQSNLVLSVLGGSRIPRKSWEPPSSLPFVICLLPHYPHSPHVYYVPKVLEQKMCLDADILLRVDMSRHLIFCVQTRACRCTQADERRRMNAGTCKIL